ncbi:MAG: hypothetical protein Q9170_004408 [Blastenia crenularia]
MDLYNRLLAKSQLAQFPSGSGACTPIASYDRLNQLGEGTYGVVFRAREKKTGKIVALKQMRIPVEERRDGVPITALREMAILRGVKCENVVGVKEVAVGEGMEEVFMVMEYCE